MKRYLFIILFAASLCINAQIQENNYVITTTMLDSASSRSKMSASYFDGLGRFSEHVEGGINPSGKGVFVYQGYDTSGRENIRTRPIVGNTGITQVYPSSLVMLQLNTYSDTQAYSETTYDALDRPTFISTPGDNWQGRGMTIRYITNGNNEVKRYTAGSTSPSWSNSYYPAGTLTGELVIDEDSVSVTTFRDLMGRVILERHGSGDDTYYIYDNNGLLRYVTQPMYQENTSSGYYYIRYKYDSKGRLTEKKLPGCNAFSYEYDQFNRLFSLQTSLLSEQSRRRFFLYDNHGRLAIQGTYASMSNTNQLPPVVSRTSELLTYNLCGSGYYLVNSITFTDPRIEIINYYDDYSFLGCPFFTDSISSSNLQGTSQVLTATLKTGDITATSDGHYLARTFYYDAEARIIDQRETLLDGSTLRTVTTYSFTGKPLTVQTTLGADSHTFVVDESYSYDANTDQLLSHDVEYEDSTVRVGSYTYDQLGRLGTEFKSDSRIGQTYSYNLHGWLTSTMATKLYNGYSMLFSQDLYYESGNSSPCYNGNVSAMKWKTLQQPYGNGYRFSYDKRNRLTEATYCNYSDLSVLPYVYSESMTYNRNSSITSLIRTGNSSAGWGNMDQLTYYYTGNRVNKIVDAATSNVYDGAFEFVDGANTTLEYWYNNDGDLTRDRNKGVTLIQYDLLNHPIRVQFANGNNTKYVYAADGRKLRTKHTTAVDGISVSNGQTLELTPAQIMDVDSTDYADNLTFKKTDIGITSGAVSLDYQFGGGYLSVTATPFRPHNSVTLAAKYVPSYHYYLRDHLGSNRMVVSGNVAVEQANEYYAYGGPWGDVSTNQGFQPYKYNGKELDRVHGLDWYDYGARHYDPAFAQFTQMDPLCEQYPHLSPYVYCAGNPVNAIDPDGMRPRRREALAMADDVYNPGKKDLPGDWTWIDPEYLGLTLPNSNGFKSAIYGRKTENGGFSEYVYATAGTDPTSIEDWKQDFKQLIGESEQYKQSVETAVKIKSILGDQELTYIGHSLGGGLASANALKTGAPAITFNAAGLSAQTKQALQLNNKTDITAYVVRNELVNNSQALIGLKAEGRISYLPSAPLSLFPRVTRPALSVAYHTMAYLKLISTLLKDE